MPRRQRPDSKVPTENPQRASGRSARTGIVEAPKNRKWRRTVYPRVTPCGWPLAARIDGKTGLLNAPAWQREARLETAWAVRTRSPLAVAIADINHTASA